MSQDNNAPSPETLQAVLEIIEPGCTFVAIHSLAGDFSNSTHLVDGRWRPKQTVVQLQKHQESI